MNAPKLVWFTGKTPRNSTAVTWVVESHNWVIELRGGDRLYTVTGGIRGDGTPGSFRPVNVSPFKTRKAALAFAERFYGATC